MCYVLVLLQSHGGLRPLLIGAALIMVAIVLSAIFAMRSRLLWIDLSYPLIAVAGLTAVLAGGRSHSLGERSCTVVPRLKR